MLIGSNSFFVESILKMFSFIEHSFYIILKIRRGHNISVLSLCRNYPTCNATSFFHCDKIVKSARPYILACDEFVKHYSVINVSKHGDLSSFIKLFFNLLKSSISWTHLSLFLLVSGYLMSLFPPFYNGKYLSLSHIIVKMICW